MGSRGLHPPRARRHSLGMPAGRCPWPDPDALRCISVSVGMHLGQRRSRARVFRATTAELRRICSTSPGSQPWGAPGRTMLSSAARKRTWPQGATSTRDGCAARILPGLPVVIGKHRVNTSQSGCGFGVIGARTMSACRPPTGPARRYQYPARDDGALFQTGRGGVLPLRVARPAEARGLVAISETPRPSGICVGASGATKCRLRPPASVGNVDCLAV